MTAPPRWSAVFETAAEHVTSRPKMTATSMRHSFEPLIDVVWVDESIHNAGLDLLLERRNRQLSLVDAVSFIAMRQRNLAEAFAFDPHFEQEGFSLVS